MVYIFAVNHLAQTAYNQSDGTKPVVRSRIELFRHTIDSSTTEHVHSIWYPLIRTPSDIVAIDAQSFYVTDDHLYLSSDMRALEDLMMGGASSTDLIHVRVFDHDAAHDSEGVTAIVAMEELPNNNGLGRGKKDDEILVTRASAGILHLLKPNLNDPPKLLLEEKIQLGSCTDNPVYFRDSYAAETGRDASGYVMTG